MEETVLFEVDQHIALITLNRPKKRNGMNYALLTALYDCLEKVAKTDEIRVAIITGKGRSFCAGLDLEAILSTQGSFFENEKRDMPDIFAACEKPIIGAINGHAITGGFELALNCDFLIASPKASFVDTHTKMGIHPGWGMTQLLQQAVGQRMAKQISFTNQFISAERALELGLVNEIVPHEELLPRAKQIASEIAATQQEMLRTVRRLIHYQNYTTLHQAYKKERKGMRGFLS